MPQPLNKIPNIQSTVYDDTVFTSRPKHMEAAMKIIVASAHAEQWFGNILIGLNHDSGVRLAKQYNSFENDAKKKASFDTLATALLPAEMQDALKLVIKKHSTATKLRHPFAHHRYGFCKEVDDLILLIDPRSELINRAELQFLDSNKPKTEAEKTVWFDSRKRSQGAFDNTIMGYQLAELESIVSQIKDAAQCFTNFWHLTSKKPPKHIYDQIYADLTQALAS